VVGFPCGAERDVAADVLRTARNGSAPHVCSTRRGLTLGGEPPQFRAAVATGVEGVKVPKENFSPRGSQPQAVRIWVEFSP
jgi:hypothetical protein